MSSGYVKCGTCGHKFWSDRAEETQRKWEAKHGPLFKKRLKLLGFLFGAWLTILLIAFAADVTVGFIWLTLGLAASFIGVILYVVEQWNTM